jgi:hypothetical protein
MVEKQRLTRDYSSRKPAMASVSGHRDGPHVQDQLAPRWYLQGVFA